MERSWIMIVQQWPKSIATADGIICNPTPEQCIQAGYELAIPPTAEEIAQRDAQRAQEEAERVEAIEVLRTAYRASVAQFCTLAGLPVVTKFADAQTIGDAIETANGQGDIQKSLGLTQLALRIEHLISELRRKDFDDAWERV